MRARYPAYAVIVLAALVAACAPQLREPEPPTAMPSAPEAFPRATYEQAQAQGKPIYQVQAANSLVAITVRRGGPLARFGHDHVVASRAVQGYVSPQEGRADLYVPLNDLTVDESALRAEASLDTQPSAADIAGTRANMLDKVLETQKYPYALIRVTGLDKNQSNMRLSVAITLHGVTRTFETAAQIEAEGDEMRVSGLIEFKQSDFGITPFSVFNGALQVLDHLSLRFKIGANLYRR
jgi:hypothetical protein